MEMHCKATVAQIHYETGNKGELFYISETFPMLVCKSLLLVDIPVCANIEVNKLFCVGENKFSTLNCLKI